jgi:endonuclease/exonuclease/phosphatase family metal-dependent hydrolase
MTILTTWNIELGGIRGRDAIAARLAQEHADVALIQEAIPIKSKASEEKLIRRFANFGRKAGFPHSYLDASYRAPWGDPNRSNTNGTLSMTAAQSWSVIRLDNRQEGVRTKLFGVQIINVHLDTDPAKNFDNARKLVAACASFPRCIIGGDFNFHKEDMGYAALIAGGYTDWTILFDRRDKVFARGPVGTLVRATLDTTVDGTLSDHPIVTVEWTP